MITKILQTFDGTALFRFVRSVYSKISKKVCWCEERKKEDVFMKNLKNSKTLNGVYETMSEIIGFDNVVKLYDNFKGSQINFPTRLFSKEFVLQEALKSYDGTSESINLIATKYSYSERTIRKLLKNHLDSLWNPYKREVMN